MIHACGMVDLVRDLAYTPDVVAARPRGPARRARRSSCDVQMVASGVTRKRLPADNDVICTLSDPAVPELAAKLGTTRSAAALELWRDRLEGSVVAVGNAPTALFRLLEMIEEGAPAPGRRHRRAGRLRRRRRVQGRAGRASVGPGPPGRARPSRRQRHRRRRGQRDRERGRVSDKPVSGRLYGVGLGPGDPYLMTVRAVEVIAEADVIAYHSARHGRSIARSIAAKHLRADHIEERLVYPVTTETTDHPGGYQGAMDEFYEEAAARLAAHLDAGRTVAVLAEGDPLFYGSYMHMHKRLADRYETEVVPGVTSVSAPPPPGSARRSCEGEEVLTILPGTLPEEELAARLAATDSAVVMKLGRTFPAVRERAGESGPARRGPLRRARHHGRASGPAAGRRRPGVGAVLLRGRPAQPDRRRRAARCRPGARRGRRRRHRPGGSAVADARDAAARSPPPTTSSATPPTWTGCRVRPGQVRHGSDNKVESERAEFALDLARRGRRVAVVSGGDPGVFAMATAVLEVAAQEEYADVPCGSCRG